MIKKLTTGLGYYKNSEDKIIGKFHFSVNSEHKFSDNLTIVEVQTIDELKAIEIYQETNMELENELMDNAKISEALRQMAIEKVELTGYVFKSQKVIAEKTALL